MEVFGEDTLHMSQMGVAYTRGLQEDPQGSPYMKIAACTKVRRVCFGCGVLV
jgi:beta-glucosidase-like glycosyl hydrolase